MYHGFRRWLLDGVRLSLGEFRQPFERKSITKCERRSDVYWLIQFATSVHQWGTCSSIQVCLCILQIKIALLASWVQATHNLKSNCNAGKLIEASIAD